MTFRILVGAALLAATSAAPAQQDLPVAELTAGFHRIEAEVAASPGDRATGLMHREKMPAQHGMVFVFAGDGLHCMWMRNTLLPLSVAFLDARGIILNVEDMKPQTLDNHCAKKPARFALEMNGGWFAARGLKAGDAIGGIDRLPRGY